MPSGPAPKLPEQRRRRNAPTHEWVVLDEVYTGPIPKLVGEHWTDATKAFWKTIWRSPMATQWEEADIPSLLEMALLRQQLMAGEFRLSAQVQSLRNDFGLSPKGRQNLRWIISEKDAERAGVDVPDELEDRRLDRRKRLA